MRSGAHTRADRRAGPGPRRAVPGPAKLSLHSRATVRLAGRQAGRPGGPADLCKARRRHARLLPPSPSLELALWGSIALNSVTALRAGRQVPSAGLHRRGPARRGRCFARSLARSFARSLTSACRLLASALRSPEAATGWSGECPRAAGGRERTTWVRPEPAQLGCSTRTCSSLL